MRALQCLNPQMLVSKPEKFDEKFQVVLKALVNTKKLKECDVDVTKQQLVSFLDEEVPQHVSKLNSFDHTIMKARKKRLESEAAALVKSADDYSVKAESTKNIDKVRQLEAQSNSHCSSSKRKLEAASKIDSEID